MRARLSPEMERARYDNPIMVPGLGMNGCFVISGPLAMELRIVSSDGSDWNDCGLPLPVWEHVSVSLARRTPTWKEMEWVRDQFWEPHETVIQFSVPRAVHISYHDFCLHMWRPIGVDVPLPPSITVAPS